MRWIRPSGWLPSCLADYKALRPGGISLKLFSPNPPHVDAQAVTII
jgi:hypothetical protein